MLKQEHHIIRGMTRDLTVSKFNPEFAYDCKNIRITARDNTTLLTVTNERGNKEIPIYIDVKSNKLSVSSNGIVTSQYPVASKINVAIRAEGNKSWHTTLEVGSSEDSTWKDNIQDTIIGVTGTTVDGLEYDDTYYYYSDIQPIKTPSLQVLGVLIGYNILNNYVTLFTTGDKDRIYRLENKQTYFEGKLLYEGNLNFNTNNPIETLSVYENDDIQKVYWLDGINQPRVINIVSNEDYSDTSFDFVPAINDKSICEVTKNDTGGNFPSGVIQYCTTYYNRYRQESNIFYISPLYYLSGKLGASPEERVNCSFNINFTNLNPDFDYLRLYAIQRTSIDATPTVRIVADLAVGINQLYSKGASLGKFTNPILSNTGIDDVYIFDTTTNVKTPLSSHSVSRTWTDSDGNTYYYRSVYVRDTTYIYNGDNFFDREGEYSLIGTVEIVTPQGDRSCRIENVSQVTKSEVIVSNMTEASYVDTGTTGETIDPTLLLYVGGESLVAGTFTQKDNTLFLGNCELQRHLISDTLYGALKFAGINIEFEDISIYNIDKEEINGSNYYYNGQLNNSKNDITHFMKGETYRLGVILKHITGKYSEVVFLQDYVMEEGIEDSSTNDSFRVRIPRPYFILTENVKNLMIQEGFTSIKPVIVYPSINDRTIICQGVVCPTVANYSDRYSKSPYVQSSWFARVMPPTYPWTAMGLEKGEVAEFRHNTYLRKGSRGAEIQSMEVPVFDDLYINPDVEDVASVSNLNRSTFFVDNNVLTLHSPDIEFDDETLTALKDGKYQFRIVGYTEFTATTSSIDIQTSTGNYVSSDLGLYNIDIGTTNLSIDATRGLLTEPFWMATGLNGDNTPATGISGFMVYPWHRAGSLINIDNTTDGQTWLPANLSKKKMSNLRYSAKNTYLDTPWESYKEGDDYKTGITPISIFDSSEQQLIKIAAAENSDYGEMTYYGNIDKILTAAKGTVRGINIEGYEIALVNLEGQPSDNPYYDTFRKDKFIYASSLPNLNNNYKYGTKPVPMKYKSTKHAVFAFNNTKTKEYVSLPVHNILWKGTTSASPNVPPFWLKKGQNDYTVEGRVTLNYYGEDTPTSPLANQLWYKPSINQMYQYVSNSWVGIAVTEGALYVYSNADLTYLYDATFSESANKYVLVLHQFTQTDIIPITPTYGYLWLGELYRSDVPNRFGGNTEEAILNNSWEACGEEIPLSSDKVVYRGGDTYYQRYDNLKTYPYTLEDVNSITEIVSFMCETRVNIDGRYDKNRGQKNNLVMTPTNFNLFNKVYSQRDNFFNYRTIDRTRFSLNKFPNMVTWSQEKSMGDLIDKWTNINMISTLDLDGDKGEVVSLNTFNNEIFCFQRRGLSNILFNSRVQIPTSDGLPIEITNGLKVGGKRYMSNTIGCSNKWAIVESPSGLYFIDNETNSMYLFNGEIKSISDTLGMRQWVSDNNTHIDWNPVTYENFRGFYDKNNNDVYFVNKDWCLCYSELLGQFTSFMSYEKVPAMFNVSSEFYAFNGNKLWEQFSGDYNMFFGQYQPYSITIVSNADEPADKIFNTVEFRADAYDGNNLVPTKTYDTLDVYNEYQHGKVELTNLNGKPSPLKRKFRIWRATIPRANTAINGILPNNRDRIRNTWAYIKLSTETPNTLRTVFHDMTVHYFV